MTYGRNGNHSTVIKGYMSPVARAYIKPWKGKAVASQAKVIKPVVLEVRPRPVVLECKNVQEWLNPECDNFSGLLAKRVPTWDDFQPFSDYLYKQLKLDTEAGESALIHKVHLFPGHHREERLSVSLSKTAERLIAPLLAHGLPESLGQQIQNDLEEVGMVVAKMRPAAKELILKAEIVRENGCSRWHRDHYGARAIYTYNNSSTEYIDDAYVNFYELEHGGNNDHIIQDPSQVCSVGLGSWMFMKGTQFPGRVKGLVHKSPDILYYPDGEVITRLCIKIDVD